MDRTFRHTAVLLSLTVGSLASATAAKLELELGAGSAVWKGTAPTVSARIGVDLLEHFTPSLRALALADVRGWYGRRQLPGEAPAAWALLAELRAHTAGSLQLPAGVGFGVGQVRRTGAGGEVVASVAPTRQVLMGDVGARLCVSAFWVGVGLSGAPSGGPMGTVSFGWAPLDSD